MVSLVASPWRWLSVCWDNKRGNVAHIIQQLTWIYSKNGRKRSCRDSRRQCLELAHHCCHVIFIRATQASPDLSSEWETHICTHAHEKKGAIKHCGRWQSRKKILSPSCAPERLSSKNLHGAHRRNGGSKNLRSADVYSRLLSCVSFAHKIIAWIKINQYLPPFGKGSQENTS